MKPLCQRQSSSCGACCGLYNWKNHGRAAVTARLTRSTDEVASAEKTSEAFHAVAKKLTAERTAALFAPVRCCPLLGFVDTERKRVGCLAHPAVTGGPDLRDCGVYDQHICESFQCPSHAWLSEEEAEMVDLACSDFYLYGLVITDVPFVRAALEAVAALVGHAVHLPHVQNPAFRRALRAVFALKEKLLPGSEGLYGAFQPGDDGEPRPRSIDYVSLGKPRSSRDQILLSMGADPHSGNDLEELEAHVERALQTAARALSLP